MTQTAPQTADAKTPADLMRAMTLTLNGYQPKIYHGEQVTTLPTIEAETDGVTLTLRCGELATTLALCDDLCDDTTPAMPAGERHDVLSAYRPHPTMLIGEGGYILPAYLPERYWALAAVLPMEQSDTWQLFDLAALAQRLGYRVLHSPLRVHIKYACTLHFFRLEHPKKGVIWGCVSTEDNCDGVIDETLLLGGVPVARYRVEATHDDHAMAGMSDEALAEEGLTRPDASVFRNVGTPLTYEKLRHVLNAVETNTVQFLTNETI